jgi:hypothetical protein
VRAFATVVARSEADCWIGARPELAETRTDTVPKIFSKRRARGDRAHALVRRGYSWQAVAGKVARSTMSWRQARVNLDSVGPLHHEH